MKQILLAVLLNFLSEFVLAQNLWKKQEVPTHDRLHDVFFLNDSLGWAYSYGTGLLLKTTDSGNNWNIICRLDSLFYEQIQFTNEKIGWLCGGNGVILKTVNGGISWEKVLSPSENTLDLIYAMTFRNEEVGFIAGCHFFYIEKAGRRVIDWSNGKYFMLQTTHGGKEWHQITNSPQSMLFTIQFLDDSIGFASGDNSIYKSKDGGQTWFSIYLDTNRTVGAIRALRFLNRQIGYTASWNGFFLRTMDGGQSWETKQISKSSLRSLYFEDEKKGYVVGNSDTTSSSMYVTHDGGNLFDSIENYPDIHRISASSRFIWICGADGLIMRTAK